ncbi:hypothetical protein B2J93_2610 [Marssonina coronariae]|uniref:GPI anchored protein n=1 Tax=Diplocarpon coronariae TaxID=2795749 RepID=A0A218YW15_9HELO|nr:hypothetical protein B2J93_2610 [Marssonina coronariae]
MTGLALAQTSTVSLYIPGADTQALVGSIVGSDATLTTYAIECAPSSTDGEACGFSGQFTLTENAASAKYTIPAELDSNGTLVRTGRIDCSLAGAASAVCVESFGGSEANFPGISTETYTGTDFSYLPVIITAGVAVTRGSPTPGVSATSTSGSSTSQTSGSSTKVQGSGGTPSKTPQAAPRTSTSTAGGPTATGNTGWVLGGAMAALAMMA